MKPIYRIIKVNIANRHDHHTTDRGMPDLQRATK